jgi:hypothetical protein
MGLGIYFEVNSVKVEASTGDDISSPIMTSHNGKNGDSQSLCLYLRNDDAAKWFSNIIVRPIDTVDANPYGDINYNETGWGVKMHKGGEEPSRAEWEDIDWGNQILLDDVGSDSAEDTTTYFPFWYLISCPPNTDAQNKTDIVLEVAYTENAVI